MITVLSLSPGEIPISSINGFWFINNSVATQHPLPVADNLPFMPPKNSGFPVIIPPAFILVIPKKNIQKGK